MNDPSRTIQKLLEENSALKQKIIELERSETARKLAEDALKVSEEKYRSIFEGAIEGIYQTTPEGRYLSVNPAFARMFGYASPKEMIDSVEDIGQQLYVNPEDRKEMVRRLREHDKVEGYEVEVYHRDGSRFWISINIHAVRDASGNILYFEGTNEDVTEHKKARVELQKLASIVTHSSELINLAEPDGNMVFLNEAGCRMLGIDPERVGQFNVREVIPDPLIPVVETEILPALERLESWEGELQYKNLATGGVTDVYAMVFAITDPGGDTLLYFANISRDISEHKRARRALEESEVKYRNIFENALEGIFQSTPEGKLLKTNPAFARMFGYSSPEEMVTALTNIGGQLYANPEDRERLVRTLDAEGAAEDFEAPMYDRQGNIIWISLDTRVVRDDDGKVLYYEGIAEDITKRRQMEEELRRSRAMYQTIFDNSGTSIIIIDESTTIVLCNTEWEKLSGFSREEVEGKMSWTEFIHPEDLVAMRKYHKDRRAQTSSPPRQYEFRYMDRYGNMRHMINTVAMIPGTGMSVAAQLDITDLKEAQKALVESEEKYRSVVENSPVGVYIVKDGLFRYVNRRFCEITGFAYEELVDKVNPLDIVHPEDRELMAENLRKRVEGEVDHIEYDFRGVRKDGRSVILRAIGTTMMYEGRRVASGSILDITREKGLEEKLLQSQKMEALGTLSGGIAHDFNNILTALTGYGTLLQMNMDQTDPLHVYVDQILSASDKATQLTRGLLAFSRRQPIALTRVGINGLIRGTEKLLKRLLTEDIELKTMLAPKDITVMADATQVDQILFNLATNARDAMPRGGVLTITTEAVDLDEELSRVNGYGKPGAYALLSISDTGVGMDKVTQEHIFDPFFTTKDVGKGTGLGLSTVYGVIKQHNGYITVYSEPGMGTTFRIYLPSVTGVGEEERKARIPVRGGNETILIAEDSEAVRGLISSVLAQCGYRTVEATDGMDAVEQFSREPNVDLLVLDSVMPRLNGREVYNEIRKLKPDIKVIFTSGYTRDVFLDKGVEDSEFNFLQKPISPDTILQKVREVLDK